MRLRLSRRKRRCGAKTRKGTPCLRRELFKNGRCRNHGGLCCGPRTEEGKRRFTMNLPWFKVRRKGTRLNDCGVNEGSGPRRAARGPAEEKGAGEGPGGFERG